MLAGRDAFVRNGVEPSYIRPVVVGDAVRDWSISGADDYCLFPYDDQSLLSLDQLPGVKRWLWPSRTLLGNRRPFPEARTFPREDPGGNGTK